MAAISGQSRNGESESFSFSGQEHMVQKVDSEGEKLDGWTPLMLKEIGQEEPVRKQYMRSLAIELNNVVEYRAEKLAATQPIPRTDAPVPIIQQSRRSPLQIAQPSRHAQGPYRQSKGISIENYNPAERRAEHHTVEFSKMVVE